MDQVIVVNPISLVLDEFFNNMVRGVHPELTFVNDPTLAIETSVRSVRAVRSAYKLRKDATLPLLTYSRTIFNPGDNQRWQTQGLTLKSAHSFDFKSIVCLLSFPDSRVGVPITVTSTDKDTTYQWADNVEASSRLSSQYVPNQLDVSAGLTCVLTFSVSTRRQSKIPLTATDIALTSTESDTTYQWKRGETNIATGASYTPVQADIDAGLTCVLTFPTPTVGTVIALTSLGTHRTLSTNADIITTYQWKRGGEDITGSIYTPTQSDIDAGLTCLLGFSKSQAGDSISLTSTESKTEYKWMRQVVDTAGKQQSTIPISRSPSYTFVERNVKDEVFNVSALPGYFDLNFKLYTQDPASLEQYELMYVTQSFLANHRKFYMDFDNGEGITILNEWPVTIQWQKLEAFESVKEGVIYYSFAGTGRFNVALVAMLESASVRLSGINLKMVNYHNENQIYLHKFFDVDTQSVLDVERQFDKESGKYHYVAEDKDGNRQLFLEDK